MQREGNLMEISHNLEESYIQELISNYLGDESLSTVEKGRRFLEWILYYLFEKTESELEAGNIDEGVIVCDGSNDGSIDAAFRENESLHLIQAKYNTAHSYQAVSSFISDLRALLFDGPLSTQKKELIDIHESIENVEEIIAYYITNSRINDNENDKISRLIESLEGDALINLEGKNLRIRILDISKINDFIDESLYVVPKKVKGKKSPIILEKYFISKENTTIIAEVGLKDLAAFIDKDKEYLFYSNIRNFLGKNKVNKDIEKTYQENPKNFWYFNNGITIVCDDFDKPMELNKGGAKVFITTPQIVNGCQTANTIYRSWKQSDKVQKSQKEGTILVKIIKDTNNKRNEITRFTNSQTAVTGKDFFALEDFHKKLKKDFSELGYTYEIQRKEVTKKKPKGNKIYSYLFDKDFKNSLFAKDVVQAFTAGMHLKPAKARNIGNLVPGGAYYDKLFNDENTPVNPKYYLFPYAIMYYSKNVLKHKEDDKLKSANLLFISIYFRLILEIFKNIELVEEDTENLIDTKEDVIKYIDIIFSNELINRDLLKLSNTIIRNFFKDTLIKKKINENLPRFLKSTVETDPEVVSIIIDKIRDELEDIDIEIYRQAIMS